MRKIICFADSSTWGYDPRSWLGGRYAPDSRWVDILAAETGWTVGNWGANGRELPDAAPDIPADTDLLIVMLGTNDLLQGRSPKATAERMERFLTGLELARGKIPLFALPSWSPGEWVPGQMLIAASRTFAGCCRTLAGRWNVSPAYDGVPLRGAGAQGPCRRDFAP